MSSAGREDGRVCEGRTPDEIAEINLRHDALGQRHVPRKQPRKVARATGERLLLLARLLHLAAAARRRLEVR